MTCQCLTLIRLGIFRTETIKMDISDLPKILDEEQESKFGFVHGVSGPGLVYGYSFLNCQIMLFSIQ